MSRPQIVIDTNVWIFARRSQRGASARLISLVGGGRFDIEVLTPNDFLKHLPTLQNDGST